MADFGDPWWQTATTSGNEYSVTWTSGTTTDNWQPQPFVAVPVVPVPEPVDDSPLGWLRGQVAEITELAWAA